MMASENMQSQQICNTGGGTDCFVTMPLVYMLYLYSCYKEVLCGPYEVNSFCRVLGSILCTVSQLTQLMIQFPKLHAC